MIECKYYAGAKRVNFVSLYKIKNNVYIIVPNKDFK